jgi:hypothetical protein
LGVIHTQQNNRAHASAASQALPVLVVKEMQRHQKYLEQRMTRLRREALRIIAGDSEHCYRDVAPIRQTSDDLRPASSSAACSFPESAATPRY